MMSVWLISLLARESISSSITPRKLLTSGSLNEGHALLVRKIAVGLEQSRGPLIFALLKYDFLVLYPINPATLACVA